MCLQIKKKKIYFRWRKQATFQITVNQSTTIQPPEICLSFFLVFPVDLALPVICTILMSIGSYSKGKLHINVLPQWRVNVLLVFFLNHFPVVFVKGLYKSGLKWKQLRCLSIKKKVVELNRVCNKMLCILTAAAQCCVCECVCVSIYFILFWLCICSCWIPALSLFIGQSVSTRLCKNRNWIHLIFLCI